jgi:hypothetical protein
MTPSMMKNDATAIVALRPSVTATIRVNAIPHINMAPEFAYPPSSM